MSPSPICEHFLVNGYGCDDDPDIDAIVVLDSSRSIGPDDYLLMQNAMISTIAQADENDFIALQQFSSRCVVEFNFDHSLTNEEMQNHVRNMEHLDGATFFKEAMRTALEDMWPLLEWPSPDEKQRIMFIVTDGQPTNCMQDPPCQSACEYAEDFANLGKLKPILKLSENKSLDRDKHSFSFGDMEALTMTNFFLMSNSKY